MTYTVRPLTPDDGEAIAGWRYPGPWATYDLTEGVADEGFWAVVDEGGTLIGFLTLGREARVPGLDEDAALLDVGVGMRPDLVGHGLGEQFGTAVLAHAAGTGAHRLRAVVQDWNQRSLALCRRLGFTETGEHHVGDVRFLVLERSLDPVEGAPPSF